MKESRESVSDLIRWLEVLSNGYVKPDVNKSTSNTQGVVRDTKKYFPFIDNINDKLCQDLGVTKPEKNETTDY